MLINQVAAGRVFRDCISDHDHVKLRFEDGIEAQVAWASSGPELKAVKQGVLSAETALPKRLHFVIGKTVKHVLTDGAYILVVFTDGHELRIDWRRRQPRPEAVNVRVVIEPPPAIMAAIGSM